MMDGRMDDGTIEWNGIEPNQTERADMWVGLFVMDLQWTGLRACSTASRTTNIKATARGAEGAKQNRKEQRVGTAGRVQRFNNKYKEYKQKEI